MFSTQNTVNVTKAAVAQLIAKGYMDVESGNITALDSQYIVDLGTKLESEGGSIETNSPADIFFKALLSQIGKVVIDSRAYIAQLPQLFVDSVNWGLFTENVMIDLSDVMIDEMWNANGFINWNATGGQAEGARIAAIEFGCYKPPVQAKLYNKAHGIMVALTTAREQFFTAFKGIDEYNSFLAGLYNSVENTLQLKAEIYALMTVSMGIATTVSNGNQINLCSEYATITGSTQLTPSKALQDANFMKYALQRIAEVQDYVKRYSAAYNNGEIPTFSSDTKAILLSKFANAAKFNVRANTYHEELVGIGDYDKVASWQGVISSSNTDPYSIENAATIFLSTAAAEYAGITVTPNTGTENIITNVIGVVYDRMAMGITVDKKKVTSQYSASRDTVNHFYHALVNYVVNDSYPIVSFTLN